MRLPKIRQGLAALTAVCVLAACGTATATSSSSTSSTSALSSSSSTVITVEDALADNIEVVEGETSYDESDVVEVELDGATADSDSEAVTVSDDGTVTLSAPGTYRLSGELAGQVVVDSAVDGAVRLVLDGADITSSTGPALNVVDADTVVVVLAEGSQNSLTDAATYEDTSEEAPTGALYSTADLTIGGTSVPCT